MTTVTKNTHENEEVSEMHELSPAEGRFSSDNQNSTDPDDSTLSTTRKSRQTSNFRSDLGPYDRKTSPEIVRYAPIRTKNAWHTNLEPVLGLHRSAQTHVAK